MGNLLHNIDKTFRSDPAECPKLITELVALLQREGWTKDEVFAIRMAVEEAFMNAVKHGNREAPDKTVDVKLEIYDDRFSGRIVDQGEGFCPDDVPDPRDDENVDCCSGRGVLLIKTFVDEVRYNQCGNAVEMTKFRNR